MTEQSAFQLLPAFISGVFAACFFMIYSYNPNKKASFYFGLAYVSGTLGYTIDFFRPMLFTELAVLGSNAFFVSTVAITMVGFATHYENPFPLKSIAAISFATMAGIAWYLFMADSVVLRSIIANFGLGMIAATSLWLIPRKDCLVIDRIIYGVMVFTTLQFFVRSSVVLYFTGPELTTENYAGSLFHVSLQFTIAVFSVALAVSICAALGLDTIADLKATNKTDPLTGLLNRRGFADEVNTAIDASHAKRIPLCMVICDIDHFKSVNDTFGHAFGDKVIKHVASILTSVAKETGIVGRIGGEEFCIVMPVANLRSGGLMAKTACSTIAAFDFKCKEPGRSITASFGVAEIMENEDYNDLFRRADEALYRAKMSGRNRVEVENSNSVVDMLSPVQLEA